MILALWAAYLVPWAPHASVSGWHVVVGDWHFFAQGSRLLFGEGTSTGPAGGLHLFANYPFLQVGPLSLVAAYLTLLVSSGSGSVAAAVVIMALGLVTLRLVEVAGVRMLGKYAPASESTVLVVSLVGGAMLLKQWSEIAKVGHLDDALALAFGATAVYCAVREASLLAGLAVGLAVASKPWALFLVPILFALNGRKRVSAISAAVAVSAAAWLPFILADPHTLAAGKATIANWPDSTLRVLGVHSGMTPVWVRPAQLLACLLVAFLVVWRGLWPAALLVAVATRLFLDGGTYAYYEAGLVLGALLLDVLVLRFVVPLATLCVFVAFQDLRYVVPDPAERGIVRTFILGACLSVPFALTRRLRLTSRASNSQRERQSFDSFLRARRGTT